METLIHEGVSIDFEDSGQGASPILMINAPGFNNSSLPGQVEHLRLQHRVVTVNLPELGNPSQLNMPPGYVEDLVWLTNELGLYRPVIVGQDTSVLMAIELAVRYPSLLAAGIILNTLNPRAWIEKLVRCHIPMLFIETRESRDYSKTGAPYPHIVVKSAHLGRLHRREVANRINNLIDEFLLNQMRV